MGCATSCEASGLVSADGKRLRGITLFQATHFHSLGSRRKTEDAQNPMGPGLWWQKTLGHEEAPWGWRTCLSMGTATPWCSSSIQFSVCANPRKWQLMTNDQATHLCRKQFVTSVYSMAPIDHLSSIEVLALTALFTRI